KTAQQVARVRRSRYPGKPARLVRQRPSLFAMQNPPRLTSEPHHSGELY
ncbi:hypothetical protein AZZ75_004937, partial [Klebsiella pneumoniae]